jgi:hypothetical protein
MTSLLNIDDRSIDKSIFLARFEFLSKWKKIMYILRRPRGRTVSRSRGGDIGKEEIVVGNEEVTGQGK